MSDVFRFRFTTVLIALVVYWIAAPLLENVAGMRILTDVCFSLLLLSAVYAVAPNRRQAAAAALLAAPMLASLWLQHFENRPWLDLTGGLFEILFFGYTAWLILAAALRATVVTREVIAAAVVVYMFLGLVWAGIYATMELAAPGSFAIPAASTGSTHQQFAYFSYTTLTTLGYGDITPLAKPARAAATLEALVGQIYIAVLIARLVAIHTAQSAK